MQSMSVFLDTAKAADFLLIMLMSGELKGSVKFHYCDMGFV